MLTLDSLTKRFEDGTVAVADLSLEVERGEFLTLLGPSGCGKTTTLRMVAGFETPTRGRIRLEGEDVTARSPQHRGFGMVFQNYALFPHLDVLENVAFGLKTRRVSGPELRRWVEASLALVDLEGYGKRRVQELSGGQQQRVALARALAPEPRVLLLDEPLSNLDAALRERTRTELRALLKRIGITAIFVTHDQEEAFALSDRIAVLERGRLQQVGTPEALYQRPANEFVASFLGRANFLDAVVVGREGDALVCEVADGVQWRVRVVGAAGAVPEPAIALDGAGGRVRILVRPESLRLIPIAGHGESGQPSAAPDAEAVGGSRSGGDAGRTTLDLDGEVLERRFAGPITHYRVRTAGGELLVHGGPADARVGDQVRVQVVGEGVAFGGG